MPAIANKTSREIKPSCPVPYDNCSVVDQTMLAHQGPGRSHIHKIIGHGKNFAKYAKKVKEIKVSISFSAEPRGSYEFH
jgi:hypothetical protein